MIVRALLAILAFPLAGCAATGGGQTALGLA